MTTTAGARPWFGAGTPNGYYEPSGLNDMAALEALAGCHVDVTMLFFNLGDTLNAGHTRAMNARGTVPAFTLIPTPVTSTTDTSALAAINSGAFDAQITANATALLGTRHMIRPLHEMNGNFNAYGQQPADFLAAWNRIRNLWRAAGNNAPFIWCPNTVTGANTVDFTPYYPGDSACEYVGLDGYSYSAEGAHSFSQLFVTGTGSVPNLATIKAVSTRPVIIFEVGIASALSGRPAWIDAMFSVLQSEPRIVGVHYWHRDSYALDAFTAQRIGAGMRAWHRARTGQS